MKEKRPNGLIHEKSPYLLQHAYNPVDWYPWGEEAFDKAVGENKPIFLSIGYSTCHWCHVMERESFEDIQVAGLLNDTFVSIKVDREERPDLDHVYMTVCQIMTGSGGWPLTIVMTPDKRPFFAGTYIPKEGRFGRMGMMELVPRIKQVWTERFHDVLESAKSIVAALKSLEETASGDMPDGNTLKDAYQELAGRFDERYGGFSTAPKFPTPHNFLFMLRYWRRTGDPKALQMVEKTLQNMRNGGIYDHLGFGFHRYATDQEWLVPHFEKMLYDQANLAMAYTEAYQATGKQDYKETAREIFQYVLRDMTSPEGGFFSAEDADSEGVEGKFYVWTMKEITHILTPEETDLIVRVFHLKEDGNFSEEASGVNTGANIFHLVKPIETLAHDLGLPLKALHVSIEAVRKKLFSARENRIHPHKDDKILTDWNGLMIAALAKGARVFGESVYAEEAEKAARFIFNKLRTPEGRLLHRYREGQAAIRANLDDYAFLIWGLLELYEVTFKASYLKRALDLNGIMVNHFWDKEAGGLFFTPDDGEALIVRKKESHDGAIPSGNAVAMLNMLRLARLTGKIELEEMAMKIGRAFSDEVKKSPSGYTQFMVAVDFALGPSYEVVIVGDSRSDYTKKMLDALRHQFIPNQVTILRPTEKKSSDIESLAPFIRYQEGVEGKTTAYVCHQNACKYPTTDISQMIALLKN